MKTKTITINKVFHNEDKGYGESVTISEADKTRYYVNDESLFGLCNEGASVTIEYDDSGKYKKVKGISPETSAPAKSNGRASTTDESIQRQVCIKAIAEVMTTQGKLPDDLEVGRYIGREANALYHTVFEQEDGLPPEHGKEEPDGSEEFPF